MAVHPSGAKVRTEPVSPCWALSTGRDVQCSLSVGFREVWSPPATVLFSILVLLGFTMACEKGRKVQCWGEWKVGEASGRTAGSFFQGNLPLDVYQVIGEPAFRWGCTFIQNH